MPMIQRSVVRVISDSIVGINKGGRGVMAEHKVKKKNIIYIIPNDELFDKLMNDEAFIDEYGRLMSRKPHRVLKELKHYVDDTSIVVRRTPTPIRTQPTVGEQLKDAVRDSVIEASGHLIDRAVDAFFYEVLPNVWYEHIVPFFRQTKEALTSKELKVDTVLAKSNTSDVATVKPKSTSREMTQEEIDLEKRKVLYHWLGMLASLKKLQGAGEIDADATLAWLTEPATLGRINDLLSENPNLLETDKYITLHDLLGRDLYRGKQLIPIEAAEVTMIAISYGYKAETEKTEE